MTDHPLYHKDILCEILQYITKGADYKAIISTCRDWHDVIASPQRAHKYMNVLSTFVMRNSRYRWKPYLNIIEYLNMDALTVYIREQFYYFDLNTFDMKLTKSRTDWRAISLNRHLTIEFITEHITKLSYPEIFVNKSPIFVDQIADLYSGCDNWVECFQYVTIEYIERYLELARGAILIENDDWLAIASNRALTREFINKYIDHFALDDLLENHYLPVDWVELVLQYTNFNLLSSNYNLTPALIREYADSWNWLTLSQNRALTIELAEEFIDRINIGAYIYYNPNVTEAFIRKHIDTSYAHYQSYTNVSPKYIREFAHKLNWIELSHCRSLTVEVAREFIDKINWNVIWMNPSITIEFLQENIARFAGILYESFNV